MSTNRLGTGERLNRFWSGRLPNAPNGKVRLEQPDSDSVPDLDEIPEYPYKGQDRFTGEFEFYYEDWKGNEQSKKGEYQYRAGSGLFIVDTSADFPTPEDVIEELNQLFQKEITESLSVRREALWDFFENASKYDELVILGPAGRFEYRTLRDVASALRDNNIRNPETLTRDQAEEVFSNAEEAQSLIPLLRDVDIPDEIEDPADLGITRDEYTIERADVAFGFRDDLVGVEYNRGDLRIKDDASSIEEEFVIQLFERDVVYPSYGK